MNLFQGEKPKIALNKVCRSGQLTILEIGFIPDHPVKKVHVHPARIIHKHLRGHAVRQSYNVMCHYVQHYRQVMIQLIKICRYLQPLIPSFFHLLSCQNLVRIHLVQNEGANTIKTRYVGIIFE